MAKKPTPLRADAQNNLEKLTQAALAAFRERGLGAPLDDIAARAGVSQGTLYNRFANREALIDAVVPALAQDKLNLAVERAEAIKDAGGRFATYITALCELQVEDPLFNDVVTDRYPNAKKLRAVCESSLVTGKKYIDAARRAKAIRADFTADDLKSLLLANAGLARDANASQRLVAFVLAGIRL